VRRQHRSLAQEVTHILTATIEAPPASKVCGGSFPSSRSASLVGDDEGTLGITREGLYKKMKRFEIE
jgi:hypothetical protein